MPGQKTLQPITAACGVVGNCVGRETVEPIGPGLHKPGGPSYAAAPNLDSTSGTIVQFFGVAHGVEAALRSYAAAVHRKRSLELGARVVRKLQQSDFLKISFPRLGYKVMRALRACCSSTGRGALYLSRLVSTPCRPLAEAVFVCRSHRPMFQHYRRTLLQTRPFRVFRGILGGISDLRPRVETARACVCSPESVLRRTKLAYTRDQ